MGQTVQLVGAVLIVSAYMAAQSHRIRFDSVQFLAMNALGAAILTVVAAMERQYGFLLLVGVLMWISTRGLRRAIKAEKEKKRAEKKKSTGRFNRPPGRRTGRRRRDNPLRRV